MHRANSHAVLLRTESSDVEVNPSKLKPLTLAMVAAATFPVAAQTGVDPGARPSAGSAKQAGYDCSGLAWTALDHCLDLNAENERAGARPVEPPPTGATDDCSGMTGVALQNCLAINRQANRSQRGSNRENQPTEQP